MGRDDSAVMRQSMNALVSEVGNPQKTSDKLMFALISIKYPQCYDEVQ